MLNISPVGRDCSREERNAFEEYDKVTKILLIYILIFNILKWFRYILNRFIMYVVRW